MKKLIGNILGILFSVIGLWKLFIAMGLYYQFGRSFGLSNLYGTLGALLLSIGLFLIIISNYPWRKMR